MNSYPHFQLMQRPRKWLNAAAEKHHYMHRSVHARAKPFGWALTFNGELHMQDERPVGFIMFSRIHYIKLRGEFGYPGLPTKWQVLQLSRLWLHPAFQKDGEFCHPGIVPGFLDRKGVWHSCLASSVIHWSFDLVQRRFLEVHPPKFMSQPYHILKVISYSDNTYGHVGEIYKAAHFRRYGDTVSKRRHNETVDTGMDGNTLTCWIYDLPAPDWDFHAGMGLPLWESAVAA